MSPDDAEVLSYPGTLPPASHDLQLITALREDLAEAGFSNEGVAEVLGAEPVAALDRDQLVAGQLRIQQLLREDSLPRQQYACAVLTGLWLVSADVTGDQLTRALPRTGAHGLQQLNLADVLATGTDDGGRVIPRADLRPYQVETRTGEADLWISSDLAAHQLAGALPHDHVLGVGGASLTLASATHRRTVKTALDLGTGCGIQLVHLLDHAEHVVGTDISERALEFARFNLLLNAPALRLNPKALEERVELLHGSLLEPVAGRSFDLVVSNPPFVITPRSAEDEDQRYIYRDGGREGDSLMAELIAGLPEVLNPGGTAQMLGNWEIQVYNSAASGGDQPDQADAQQSGADQPSTDETDAWEDRPRSWVQQAGLHAWVIQRDRQSPAQYAEIWLRDAAEERDQQQYQQRYAEYLRDFASRQVGGVGFGLLWLQKPETPDAALWQRFEEITGNVQQPLGPVIGRTAERALAAQHSDEQILEQPLTVAEDVTEERYQRFGAEHPEVIIARQGSGFRRARPVSSAAAGFLGAADGEFSAAQLIPAVCSLTGTEEDALAAEVLDLYIDGFLSA